ncbi:hypothetical protein K1719_002249 [Acacia pycnantha]|nr:hypothetical protein K1719_002249 [Acacia pycnantha]
MSKLHVLIFPYPAQGHILPLLDLTHQLVLQGAFLTSVNNFCWQNIKAIKDQTVAEFSDLPGMSSFKEEHLPSIFRIFRESDLESEFVKESFLSTIVSWGCIFNSFGALEVAILNHRAVGGFLSHCGWNSVLEGILAGVMILGWPMEADQFVNAKLLVDDKGVAVRVCEGADSVPDPEELGRIISKSVGADNG